MAYQLVLVPSLPILTASLHGKLPPLALPEGRAVSRMGKQMKKVTRSHE